MLVAEVPHEAEYIVIDHVVADLKHELASLTKDELVDYNSFFVVRVGGEILDAWGMEGTVAWNHLHVWKIGLQQQPALYWKIAVSVEVIGDGYIPDFETLSDIESIFMHGGASGHWQIDTMRYISGEQMVKECHKHNTDPEFFMLGSSDGNLEKKGEAT